jgi:Protein of unknown function (DUF3078)
MKFSLITIVLTFLIPLSIEAQKIESPTFQTDTINVDSIKKKWTIGGGLGFDLAAITLINPRVNEGEGRINAGGLFDFVANYQGKRLIWNNNIQLSLTRDGAEDWAKSTDALLFNTQLGLRLKGSWYAAGMVDVQTQILNTYGEKYLRRFTNSDTLEQPLSSRAFAPASFKLAPGLLFKPNNQFSALFSAISTKTVIISDISLDSLLGITNDKNQFGAELRFDYTNKFANDKIQINSSLDFYSNYLLKPENVACEWLTSLDIMLNDHFSINLKSDWFYDHSILVKIGGNSDDLGRRVFIRNSFFLKFNKMF